LLVSAPVGVHEANLKHGPVGDVLCSCPLAARTSVVVADYLASLEVAQEQLVVVAADAPVAGIAAGRLHAALSPV